MNPYDDANAQFHNHLERNPYPGRGLVLGHSQEGALLLIYWIMGRSEHSRNRRFEVDGPVLRTVAVDPTLLEDPSLIIYDAMLELPGLQLASNGDQTRTLKDGLQRGLSFEQALREREREPDSPNYTPRISGLFDLRGGSPELYLSLLKGDRFDPAQTARTTYQLALPPRGLGLGLTTYMGDGTPLPSYRGEPLCLPCEGSAEQVLARYFEALDPDNRIAVAVKHVDPTGRCLGLHVRNRYGSG